MVIQTLLLLGAMASGKARDDEERDVHATEPLRPAQIHDRSRSSSISRAPEPPTYTLYADEEAGRAPRTKLMQTGNSGPDKQDLRFEARRKKMQEQQRAEMTSFSDAAISTHFQGVRFRIFTALFAILVTVIITVIVYLTVLRPRSKSND